MLVQRGGWVGKSDYGLSEMNEIIRHMKLYKEQVTILKIIILELLLLIMICSR